VGLFFVQSGGGSWRWSDSVVFGELRGVHVGVDIRPLAAAMPLRCGQISVAAWHYHCRRAGSARSCFLPLCFRDHCHCCHARCHGFGGLRVSAAMVLTLPFASATTKWQVSRMAVNVTIFFSSVGLFQ
jgi:hypothetical protein